MIYNSDAYSSRINFHSHGTTIDLYSFYLITKDLAKAAMLKKLTEQGLSRGSKFLREALVIAIVMRYEDSLDLSKLEFEVSLRGEDSYIISFETIYRENIELVFDFFIDGDFTVTCNRDYQCEFEMQTCIYGDNRFLNVINEKDFGSVFWQYDSSFGLRCYYLDDDFAPIYRINVNNRSRIHEEVQNAFYQLNSLAINDEGEIALVSKDYNIDITVSEESKVFNYRTGGSDALVTFEYRDSGGRYMTTDLASYSIVYKDTHVELEVLPKQ